MNIHRGMIGLIVVAGLICWSGCGRDSGKKIIPPEPTTPEITALQPDSAAAGDTILVLGLRFGATQGTSRVLFGSLESETSSWSDTQIEATVPTGAQSGTVRVVVNDQASNEKSFQVGSTPPPPVITIDRLIPVRTVVADTVRVIGTGFGAPKRQVSLPSPAQAMPALEPT